MKKVKFIAVALALAVVMVGVGFAAWSENIPINGTMATGELRWSAVNANVLDNSNGDPWNWSQGIDWVSGPDMTNYSWNITDKNVGRTSIATVAEANGDVQTINVAAENTYPGYWSFVGFKVKNTGSIPIKIQTPVITSPPETNVVMWFGSTGMIGQVLAPGETTSNEIFFLFRVDESAQESSTYDFTVQIPGVQWNQ